MMAKLWLLLVGLVAIVEVPSFGDAFVVAVDFGSQYFKAAVVAPGKPFEVVHNTHSKRKTPTAVSFNEKVRAFGDDAIMSASKGVPRTPMYFPLQLGRNLTGVGVDDLAWLPKKFYPYKLAVNESGSLRFEMGDDSLTVEEASAHVLSFLKRLAQEAADGQSVSESVLTVPSQATFAQRRAVLAAAKIAGLPRAQLLHETSAAALQRSLDLDLSGANGTANESLVLFYNMGSLHVECCVVRYTGATHMNKPTVAMDVLGCGHTSQLGGLHVDMRVAQKMLEAFQAKFPKLADGITSSVRSLRKLEKEAMGAKHVLSANKEVLYRVESLYDDRDFSQQVKREDFEEWCAEIFAAFSKPIETALSIAKVSLDDLDAVEMIGGGWRIPRVQSLLSDHLRDKRAPDAPPLVLSQHVNGDEAMATGAAFYGANSSASFRTKKVFFTDATTHGYTLELRPLNATQEHEDGWFRSLEIFPAGSKLRARKTVKVTISFDLKASILENGNPILNWDIEGVHAAATGRYVNLSTPLVSLKLELDASGVVQMSSATAIFDENVTVEVDVPVRRTGANASGANDSSANASADAASAEGGAEADAQAPAEDTPGAEDGEADGEKSAADAGGAEGTGDANATANASANASATGKVLKTKVKKRKVTLSVEEDFKGIQPRPLSEDEIGYAIARLQSMDADDAEVKKIDAAKNALEAFIYESRDKLNDDEFCLKVSSEEERGKVFEALTAMEEWFFEDEAKSANATMLDDKLRSLQDLVFPIRRRAFELEQRPALPELIQKVKDYVNSTLAYVEKNMTWVSAADRQGVENLTSRFEEWYANVSEIQEKLDITAEPAYTVQELKGKLHKMQTEAQRLTKIRKIDPMPYSSDYGRYGGYGGKWDDPKMRSYYEAMMKNFSRNGTNYSDWFKNFSNFSGFNRGNDSDYMRSFYEHAARNFSTDGNESDDGFFGKDSDEKTEL